jgi:uncharacterized protein (TIGR00369 family)
MDALDRVKALDMPSARLWGIEFTAATKDRIVAEVIVQPHICTIPETMHGGAIMAVADTLGAAGTVLNLPEGRSTATLESKTNFIGPAPLGSRVIAEATPLHRGRRSMVWQTRLTTAEGRLVAIVTQTQMVL